MVYEHDALSSFYRINCADFVREAFVCKSRLCYISFLLLDPQPNSELVYERKPVKNVEILMTVYSPCLNAELYVRRRTWNMHQHVFHICCLVIVYICQRASRVP